MEVQVDIPSNPYLLLTPGPLSTSAGVRQALLRDWCTWDKDYNQIVQDIRNELVKIATDKPGAYTSVLMQGSGTFSVESVIGSAVPEAGCLLVLANGAYGKRIGQIAEKLRFAYHLLDFSEMEAIDVSRVEKYLLLHPEVTHVAMVHCETTTGILNDVKEIAALAKSKDKIFILDAMSSYGGIPLDVDKLGIDFLISSANKCIQGVPGFGFIIATNAAMESCRDNARSLSLDLYDQWRTMEEHHGKWRYTSPTHTVRAFAQALEELKQEGGVKVRYERYRRNQKILVKGLKALGFECLLPEKLQSPFITAFLYPQSEVFSFDIFYESLKAKGFVIYPGKVTDVNTFRIGNIGEVYEQDVLNLLSAIKESIYW